MSKTKMSINVGMDYVTLSILGHHLETVSSNLDILKLRCVCKTWRDSMKVHINKCGNSDLTELMAMECEFDKRVVILLYEDMLLNPDHLVSNLERMERHLDKIVGNAKNRKIQELNEIIGPILKLLDDKKNHVFLMLFCLMVLRYFHRFSDYLHKNHLLKVMLNSTYSDIAEQVERDTTCLTEEQRRFASSKIKSLCRSIIYSRYFG